MKRVKLDFKGAKVIICGLQGSGKTTLARELVKKKRALIYTPHVHEWLDLPDNIIVFKDHKFGAHVDQFIRKAKRLGQRGIIEGVVFDEFDMLFRSNHDIKEAMNDVVINHRHYNLFMVGITRRPQDIPTKVFESSKYIISFALQGGNVRKKFNDLHEGLGDLIKSLSYKDHEFVIKEIGEEPVVIRGYKPPKIR